MEGSSKGQGGKGWVDYGRMGRIEEAKNRYVDKSMLQYKSLEEYTFWMLVKDNRNMKHGGISWCPDFTWNFH